VLQAQLELIQQLQVQLELKEFKVLLALLVHKALLARPELKVFKAHKVSKV
jgi:hypothetical protein